MTERLLMRQVREILRLKYEQGLPHRAIARACGVGLGTVSEYCRRAQRAALTWPLPADLDDAQLEARLFRRIGDVVGVPRPLPDMAWIHQELKRPGVTLQRLHLEYLARQPDWDRYSQFCRHYHDWARTLAPTMRHIHRAGEKAFVDFSGKRPVVYRVTTGERRSTAWLAGKGWFWGGLGARRFFSVAELTAAIRELLAPLHARPMRKLGVSRRALFEQLDQPLLRPLPASRYEFAEWRDAGVNIDDHVLVEHNYYSVPYQLVHQRVEVRLAATTVELFLKGRRIASHRRRGGRGQYATEPAHMPHAHRAHAEWTPSRLISWAETTGPATAALVAGLLASKPHPEQGYRACLGLMRLSKTHGPARMDAACARALHLGAPSYRTVQNILASGADRIALPDASAASPRSPSHPNIRGRAYYTGEETTPCSCSRHRRQTNRPAAPGPGRGPPPSTRQSRVCRAQFRGSSRPARRCRVDASRATQTPTATAGASSPGWPSPSCS